MFCVYLTYYKGNLLPKWYIGSSSIKKVENGYTGSVVSKRWKHIYETELTNNRGLFKTRIIYRCEERKAATDEEYRLQKLHKVVVNEKYFNESYASKNGCFTRNKKGELNPMYKQGHKISGRNNGRHKDNYDYKNSNISANISKGLKKSTKNKKGNNNASKKYYIYCNITKSYTDLDKGYLTRFCEIFRIRYQTLYNTLHTKKPVQARGRIKNKNTVGYQLFEGTYKYD